MCSSSLLKSSLTVLILEADSSSRGWFLEFSIITLFFSYIFSVSSGERTIFIASYVYLSYLSCTSLPPLLSSWLMIGLVWARCIFSQVFKRSSLRSRWSFIFRLLLNRFPSLQWFPRQEGCFSTWRLQIKRSIKHNNSNYH